jgi:hypothetical protein
VKATRIVIDSPGLHIPAGDTEDDGAWRPTLCGGGVPNPAGEKTVPEADVCPECMLVVWESAHPHGALAERMAAEVYGRPTSRCVANLRRHGMLRVLALLEAEGWGPGASRCRDGVCSGIVDANEDMVEALTAARAEVEQLTNLTRLLGPARRVLDRCAEDASSDARAEAATMAQRIVDWIGHTVTDEPARAADLRAEVERLRRLLADVLDPHRWHQYEQSAGGWWRSRHVAAWAWDRWRKEAGLDDQPSTRNGA